MKLSIITINLNNAIGLDNTLQSIFNQTYTDIELIIIDGNSSDHFNEVIRKHETLIDFWVSEPDNGVYHAMNKGIEKATGEYCYFLNSGDALAGKNALNDLFDMEITEDIIQCNMIVTEHGVIKGIARGKYTLTFTDILGSIIKHQGTLIRRDLFSEYGLYNENLKLIADFEFFLKAVGFGNASYRYINHDLAIYDNCGLSNSNSSLVKSEREQVISQNLPEIMIPDFSFLLKYRKIKLLDNYVLTRFILRTLIKISTLIKKG